MSEKNENAKRVAITYLMLIVLVFLAIVVAILTSLNIGNTAILKAQNKKQIENATASVSKLLH